MVQWINIIPFNPIHFKVEFCIIRGLHSNVDAVCHHLETARADDLVSHQEGIDTILEQSPAAEMVIGDFNAYNKERLGSWITDPTGRALYNWFLNATVWEHTAWNPYHATPGQASAQAYGRP